MHLLPEFGQVALILALLIASLQAILPLLGAQRGLAPWMAIARPTAWAQLVLVGVAFAILTWAFVVQDFSLRYVATNSNSLLPMLYRYSAVWGAHEGSLLLWALILSLWTAAVAMFSKSLPEQVVARVLGVMGIINVGFLAFLIFTSNPFERILPGAAEGRDLNPLLQDFGLIVHPPMLYMGYVGFAVPFAFAIAALLDRNASRPEEVARWLRWTRPWTNVAWGFLTIGIALGSWWAYYELGWGGWWFWDPVENASFLPWLVGTALIHSLAVTEKRGAFKNWTVLLAISAFSLSLLGTFLVRSGVLTSVHAFASDPSRGVFILMLLAAVVGSSLTLFAWRAPSVSAGGGFAMISRETFLLMNNVILVVATGSVLLGTLYPLIVDALGGGKLSVGPPYFNAVFVPVMIPLLFLMALGPIARWKEANLREMTARLRLGAVLAVLAGIALPLLMGKWHFMTALGCLLAVWIAAAVVFQTRDRLRTGNPPPSYWGMQVAHMGIAIFVVGVTMVGSYQEEKDVRMSPGDTVTIGDYTFRLTGVSERPGPNYLASVGEVELLYKGKHEKLLHPEKRQYLSSTMPMTEAAIETGLARDLYVSLGEPLDKTADGRPDMTGAWAVRVYYKPFVDWIWGGCLLMALGGLLAVVDRRYRIRRVAQTRVDGTKVAA